MLDIYLVECPLCILLYNKSEWWP